MLAINYLLRHKQIYLKVEKKLRATIVEQQDSKESRHFSLSLNK